MSSVPDWRPGAIYHRPLVDQHGFATGREVTVYPKLFGEGRLCEGSLAAEIYDHEYEYATVGEAVHAAEEWVGHGAPPGAWKGYRSKNNGDKIFGEDKPTARDRAQVVNDLVRQQFPEVAKAFRQTGVAASDFMEKMKDMSVKLAPPADDPLTLGSGSVIRRGQILGSGSIRHTLDREDAQRAVDAAMGLHNPGRYSNHAGETVENFQGERFEI